jgi:hypothetical protein
MRHRKIKGQLTTPICGVRNGGSFGILDCWIFGRHDMTVALVMPDVLRESVQIHYVLGGGLASQNLSSPASFQCLIMSLM